MKRSIYAYWCLLSPLGHLENYLNGVGWRLLPRKGVPLEMGWGIAVQSKLFFNCDNGFNGESGFFREELTKIKRS